MKFLFLVQGEGRGHMTQAVSLKKKLEDDGHTVYAGVGINPRREIPAFFSNEFNTELFRYQSPNFITDKKGRGLQISRSIYLNLLKTRHFLTEIKKIRGKINAIEPDGIINFYEPLGGLMNLFSKSMAPTYGIGHQFLLLHPDFKLPRSNFSDRVSLQNFTRITGLGCRKFFGLSFYELPDTKKIIPVPPLLRQQILNLQSRNEGFLLVYILNPGYIEEVKRWAANNPGTKVCCFTDALKEDTYEHQSENLTLYGLSGTKFLELLSKCKGLVTTAGFESVCEAMYLKKPVLMVPVENHFEQYVNSRDGHKAGAGIYADRFDFDSFLSWMESEKGKENNFEDWVDRNQDKITREIYSDLNRRK